MKILLYSVLASVYFAVGRLCDFAKSLFSRTIEAALPARMVLRLAEPVKSSATRKVDKQREHWSFFRARQSWMAS